MPGTRWVVADTVLVSVGGALFRDKERSEWASYIVTIYLHDAIPPAFLYTGIRWTIRSTVVVSFDSCPGLASTPATAATLAFAWPGHNGSIRLCTRAPVVLAAFIPIPVPIRLTLDCRALARRMRDHPLPGERHLRRGSGTRGAVHDSGDSDTTEWTQIGVHVARPRGRKGERWRAR